MAVTGEAANRVTRAAPTSLAEAAEAGLVTSSDTQLARHLAHLHGEADPAVVLAAALVFAALRAGSVCLDLDALPAHALLPTAWADAEPTRPWADPGVPPALVWPDRAEWDDRLAHSPLVTLGDGPSTGRPLRLADGRLYVERSWDDQERVARSIRGRLAREPRACPGADYRLDQVFGPPQVSPDRSRDAAQLVLAHSVSVVGGGPGTGKTTTVARLLAVLADPDRPPRILLAAPTGKAAARLDAAVRTTLTDLGRRRLADAIPSTGTVHRILGIRPWGGVVHDARHPLPVDLVVVDEVSMLSLHHMRLLLEAIPLSARLVLLGDPDQLASVEAGAVLADLVAEPAPAAESDTAPGFRQGTSTGPGGAPGPAVPFVRLDRNYRFGGPLADLAAAMRTGDAPGVLRQLAAAGPEIEFIESLTAAGPPPGAADGWAELRATVATQRRDAVAALARWDATGDEAALDEALRAANRHRLLCAHRQGPFGVARWGRLVADWSLAGAAPAERAGPWPVGLTVQVTRNDETLGVFNGDTGIITRAAGQARVALPTAAGWRLIGPAELDGLEPAHATTIHKAQGSQFDSVTIIVPEPGGSLLTRELLYTAVTRAQHAVRLIGTPEAVAHAVAHPALRASGLAARLRSARGPREGEGSP